MAVASGLPDSFHLPVTALNEPVAEIPAWLGVIDGNPTGPATWTLPPLEVEIPVAGKIGAMKSGCFLYVKNSSQFQIQVVAADGDTLDGNPDILVQPNTTLTLIAGAPNSHSWRVLGNGPNGPGAQSPFHGFWASLVKGDMVGFDNQVGAGVQSSDVDAYIYIDMTQLPAKILTIAGNGRVVRGNQDNEVAVDPTYVQVDEKTLLSSVVAYGEDPFFPANYAGLVLQEDGKLSAANPGDGLFNLYQKIKETDLPNPLIPYDAKVGDYPDYTRPTLFARYVFDHIMYHCSPTVTTLNKDFIGFYAAEARFQEYLNGVTKTCNVVKFRKTANGSGVTDVYTDAWHFASAGSTVTIAGAANTWAAINGTYVNGSSVHYGGGTPNPSASHIDANGGEGSYLPHMLLNFDSSACAAFTGNAGYPYYANGVATSTHFGEGPVTLSVTHKFTDDMEYPAFYGALMAMFYDIFQVDQHHGWTLMVANSGDKFLPDTWEDLQSALSAGTVSFGEQRSRGNYPQAVATYNNPVLTGTPYSQSIDVQPLYSWLFNDAYGFLPTSGGIYDYDIPVNNFLVGVRNLYYTLDGVPTKPLQSLAGLIGYKNMSKTTDGGAYFVGTTAPYDPSDPASTNPDPDIWTLMGGAFDGSDAEFAANILYFGWVNPALTGGKRVAYFHVGYELGFDPLALMYDYFGTFVDGETTRPLIESTCAVFAEAFKYLNSQGPLDGFIFDSRNNFGGIPLQDPVMASFFGAQRTLQDPSLAVWRDNGNRPSVSYESLGVEFYADSLAYTDGNLATADINLTVARYGANSVIQNVKFVYLISANESQSAGDQLTSMWLGQNNDKNLGGGVQAKFFGSVDGRCRGGSVWGFSDCLPKQKYSNRLYDQNGDPVSLVPGCREDDPFGIYNFSYNGRPCSIQDSVTAIDPAPTLQGWAGGNPLPEEFESLTYVDLGFMTPHPDPPLPGWVGLHGTGQPDPTQPGTWRDRWLEQCIIYCSS